MLHLHHPANSRSSPNLKPSSYPGSDMQPQLTFAHRYSRYSSTISLDDSGKDTANLGSTTTSTEFLETSKRSSAVPLPVSEFPATSKCSSTVPIPLPADRPKEQNRRSLTNTLHAAARRIKLRVTKRSTGYSSLHEDECMCRKQQVYGGTFSPRNSVEVGGRACKVHYHELEAGRQTGKTNPME